MSNPKTPSPGEWQERYGKPSIYVQNLNDSVEIYMENGEKDVLYQTTRIILTPGQARTIAEKLIELANHVDSNGK